MFILSLGTSPVLIFHLVSTLPLLATSRLDSNPELLSGLNLRQSTRPSVTNQAPRVIHNLQLRLQSSGSVPPVLRSPASDNSPPESPSSSSPSFSPLNLDITGSMDWDLNHPGNNSSGVGNIIGGCVFPYTKGTWYTVLMNHQVDGNRKYLTSQVFTLAKQRIPKTALTGYIIERYVFLYTKGTCCTACCTVMAEKMKGCQWIENEKLSIFASDTPGLYCVVLKCLKWQSKNSLLKQATWGPSRFR
ncbi:hypothetical protein DFH08DRAFT_806128 [Mycena albidolilacea]|uniref:Uncharacterized protein n=1 Tax=Mycena albidolilacea TaxID=1033008 RepID=A0AAD7A7M8_9AGAR|nr:hypothetical protein DFH08DRAFT_806128 [Mycena albidolilacea]